MRMLCFDMDAQRSISAAHRCHFTTGSCHPDRVMQEHDLIYMLNGSWEIYLEDQMHLLTPDHVLILPAGLHHYGLKECTPDTQTLYIHVSSGNDQLMDTPSDDRLLTLPALIDCRKHLSVRSVFEQIVTDFNQPQPFRQARVSAAFTLLLTTLYDACHPSGTGDPLVAAAVNIIQAEPTCFHPLPELARRLYVCPRTLSGRFRQALGCTPHQYELATRLDAAKAFLQEYPDARLREAAANFGFCDEFHLSRSFSKRYGIAPGPFRKACRNSCRVAAPAATE